MATVNPIDIDYIFPYVDSSDPLWRESYTKYRPLDSSARFRDLGFLKYVFRGLDKCCPWLRHVVFIVSDASQVPSWLDRENPRLRIVYHRDFIPAECLPCYNSNLIEMFLWNIDGLSEHVLYGNDDFFPVGPCESTDYFDIAGAPLISFEHKYTSAPSAGFINVCWRSDGLVLGDDVRSEAGEYILPLHTATPLLASEMRNVWSRYYKEMLGSVTMFRDSAKNFNQYIYSDYLYHNKKCVVTHHDMRSVYCNLAQSRDIVKNLIERGTFICLNDVRSSNADTVRYALELLGARFPEPCSFEK